MPRVNLGNDMNQRGKLSVCRGIFNNMTKRRLIVSPMQKWSRAKQQRFAAA